MMLRLVVLVGVVTCSPLPDDLIPPAATSTHHHDAALPRPSLVAHFPLLPHSPASPLTNVPSAGHDSSAAANPSSAAHVDVTHEVRHVTFEVSEEVREGGGVDDLTTPGDLPEDDPPIPTATTPPALPDTHHPHHHHHGHSDNVHTPLLQSHGEQFDQGSSQDDLDFDVQSSTTSPSQGTTETTEASNHQSHRVLFHDAHAHQDEAKTVDSHTKHHKDELVGSEHLSSHIPVHSQVGDSSWSQMSVTESGVGGQLNDSIERDPSVESFERESLEKDRSVEPFEHPSTELVEKYPSAESVEKHPSVELLEKEFIHFEPVVRDSRSEVVSLTKDRGVAEPAVENVASQSYTASDDGVSDEDSEGAGAGNTGSSSSVISAHSETDGKDHVDVISVSAGVGEASSGKDGASEHSVNVGEGDVTAHSPSTTLHHHHHHHHQKGDVEGAGRVIEKDDSVPMIDVRKEDSSEEKAVMESRGVQDHNMNVKEEEQIAGEPHDETAVEEEEERDINNNNKNTVKSALESLSQVSVETLNHESEDRGALRRINVWDGGEDSLEESTEGEEGRHERKTRPEDGEVPTFIMDSSAPIDIVERSGGHEKDAEVLETSASEVTEEVVSGEDGEGARGDEEGGRKSRIYVEPPSLTERVGTMARKVPKTFRDGLEVMSMTSPTPLTPQQTQGEGGEVAGAAGGEAPPLESEELEATESPSEIGSEETVSEDGDDGEADDSGSKEVDELTASEAPAVPQPSSVTPQDYTDTYGDIITGVGLPDFSVTQEEVPSLTNPHPDPPPLPSNRGKIGDPTWQLPPQQEQVSVAAPASLTPGCIVAIVFGVIVSLAIILGIGGFVIWQRRTLNRPKALGSDRGYAGSDSLGYLDDQVHVSYVNSQVDSTKGSPEDLISLDMDSDFFLNSLESMTIQNLWPENIRHTKL